MRFRKLISGTCRVDAGEWLDSDEDSAWYASLRAAVQRCRDDDDTRHVAYEDFDASGRALVDQGVERILTATKNSVFVPKWARLELHKAFVISYDAAQACSSHAEHVDPGSDVTINCPLTPDDEYEGGELMLRLFPDAYENPAKSQMLMLEHYDGPDAARDLVGCRVNSALLRLAIYGSTGFGVITSIQEDGTAFVTLDSGHVVKCPKDLFDACVLVYPTKDITPRRGAVVVHGGGIQHGARALTRGARSALIIWTKRRCSFDVQRLPDDVRRKMLPYWTWRDQLALAAASKGSRRVVAMEWSGLRRNMAQRIPTGNFHPFHEYNRGGLQNVIASAPPGRDAIAGTVAMVVAVADAHVAGVGGGGMAAHRRAELLRRLVQLALWSLLHECDDKRCRHLPWDMWFDESLVKDGAD